VVSCLSRIKNGLGGTTRPGAKKAGRVIRGEK